MAKKPTTRKPGKVVATNAQSERDATAEAARRIGEARRSEATELDLSGLSGLRQLPDDIAVLTSLRALTLTGTAVADLAPLAGLTALQTLSLDRTAVADLAPLSGLNALDTLSLAGTAVGDLVPLASLTAVQWLSLVGTSVADLAPLAGLTGLQTLLLDLTAVADLAPLAGLTALQTLSLGGTTVSDLAPLAGLTALQTLLLDGAAVADLAPLAGLTALQTLSLDRTAVADLSILASQTGLADAALSSQSARQGLPVALSFDGSKATRSRAASKAPLKRLAKLDDPERTVETINFLRRQQGLPEYWPESYRRLEWIEEIFADRSSVLELADDKARSKKPPVVPSPSPAALEPEVRNGRISLPGEPPAADLEAADLESALRALKADLEEFVLDLDQDGNADRRVVGFLRTTADIIPHAAPPQDLLFRLAHRQETLDAYGPTAVKEWPDILASRYLVICRNFERTTRQFPKWREFVRNAAKDRLTTEQLAAAAPIVKEAVASLKSEESAPFVDQSVPAALEELAEPLETDRDAFDPLIIEAGKERLVEDLLESVNNVLKTISLSCIAERPDR